MVEGTLRESVKWCFGRQENLPLRAAWPRLLEVVQNSLTGFTHRGDILALYAASDVRSRPFHFPSSHLPDVNRILHHCGDHRSLARSGSHGRGYFGPNRRGWWLGTNRARLADVRQNRRSGPQKARSWVVALPNVLRSEANPWLFERRVPATSADHQLGVVGARMVKILEQLENQKAAMMEFRMKNGNHWARLLAYVTGLINQELLLQNEYLAAENRILRAHLPARLRLSDPERCTLAEISKRLGRKALEKVACVAKPDSILAWYRRLIAHKFDGSQCRTYPGRPRISAEVQEL